MSWTDERVATVKKLFNEGLSATQIAKQLGGVTRNAVIGKVHRLQLVAPTSSTRRTASPPRSLDRPAVLPLKGPSEPKSMTLGIAGNGMTFDRGEVRPPREAVELPYSPGGLRIIDTPHGLTGCRWPISGPEVSGADIRFCCAKRAGHPNYCPDHAKRARSAFQPAKPKSPPPLGGGQGYRYAAGKRFAE